MEMHKKLYELGDNRTSPKRRRLGSTIVIARTNVWSRMPFRATSNISNSVFDTSYFEAHILSFPETIELSE